MTGCVKDAPAAAEAATAERDACERTLLDFRSGNPARQQSNAEIEAHELFDSFFIADLDEWLDANPIVLEVAVDEAVRLAMTLGEDQSFLDDVALAATFGPRVNGMHKEVQFVLGDRDEIDTAVLGRFDEEREVHFVLSDASERLLRRAGPDLDCECGEAFAELAKRQRKNVLARRGAGRDAQAAAAPVDP